MNDHEIDWNHDTRAKLGNLKNLLLNDVSSVSAQKLECPSSAWLVSNPFQLGLAQLGIFQLELITSVQGVWIQNLMFWTACVTWILNYGSCNNISFLRFWIVQIYAWWIVWDIIRKIVKIQQNHLEIFDAFYLKLLRPQ